MVAKAARVILAPALVQEGQGVAHGPCHGHAPKGRAGQGEGEIAQILAHPFPETLGLVQGVILPHGVSFHHMPGPWQHGAQKQRAQPVQADGIEAAVQDHILIAAHVKGTVVRKKGNLDFPCAIGVHHGPDPVRQLDQNLGNIDAVGRKQGFPVDVGKGNLWSKVVGKGRDHVRCQGKGFANGPFLQLTICEGLRGYLEMFLPVGEEVFLCRKAPGASGYDVCSV